MPAICSSSQPSRSFVSGSPSHQKNGTMPKPGGGFRKPGSDVEVGCAVGEADGAGGGRREVGWIAQREFAGRRQGVTQRAMRS